MIAILQNFTGQKMKFFIKDFFSKNAKESEMLPFLLSDKPMHN